MDKVRLAELRAIRRKTAAVTMKDIDKINEMTARNDHTGALTELADQLGRKKDQKVLELMGKIQDILGYAPHGLMEMRNEMMRPIYAQAKKTFMKDGAGNLVKVYDLLD